MTLKRTGFKPRTAPMGGSKGAAFARVERKEKAASLKAARGMKSKRPKMTPIRSSARGEACTLRFPCCSGDPATTVWCHSNSYKDGKGGALKARDEEGCYGCFTCHMFLDGGYAGHMPRSLVDIYFDIARKQSQDILRRKGLMKSERPIDCESLGLSSQTLSMGKDSTMNMISEHDQALAIDEAQP